ncbi:MAG: thioredoxin domain-containing protein [bacterium]
MTTSLNLPSATDESFATDVAPGTGLVAVEFSAEWCPPCHLMAPIIERVAQEYASSLRVLQVDADANPRTMVRLGVRGLPTMLVFRDGALVDRIVGAVSHATLRERLGRLIGAEEMHSG